MTISLPHFGTEAAEKAIGAGEYESHRREVEV
jgi:hypothetical protein